MTALDIHTLAGAYALDAVDDLERAAFARHLSQCPSCRTEVDELREATGRLADGAWSVPPPRMRDAVLTQIRQTRQLPPRRRPEREGGGRNWRRWTAAAVAAGILAVGAGAATYAVQEQRLREQRTATAAARADAARVQDLLAAPDVKLHTAAVTGGGRVTVAVSQSRDEAAVLLAGTAPAGPGRTYQMWRQEGGEMINAKVMPPGQTAGTVLMNNVRNMTGFGLSVEPEGGSATPTTTAVVALVPLV